MGQEIERLRAAGAEVVAAAVTATFSQMAFAEHLQVPFPLLSDWEGEACTAFGVRYDVWKGHRGLAKRSLFVIDSDHVVRHVWVTEDATELPDMEWVVSAVEDLARV